MGGGDRLIFGKSCLDRPHDRIGRGAENTGSAGRARAWLRWTSRGMAPSWRRWPKGRVEMASGLLARAEEWRVALARRTGKRDFWPHRDAWIETSLIVLGL